VRIAINGAGIAGTTLAYWLLKAGHEVLLVEEAPRLRTGGYLIDFWGGGYDIAEKMGLIPQLKALGYQMKEVRYIDAEGRRQGGFPVEAFRRLTNDRFREIRRSDLAAMIYGAMRGPFHVLFGDSILGCDDLGDRVRVSFHHAESRDVDLVVGADGLHSRIRSLVFGPERTVEVSLGYHVAAFEVEGYRPRDELVAVTYSAPGRQISRLSLRDDRTLFLFVFRDQHLGGGTPSNDEERRAALRHVFGHLGWECPRILEAMAGVSDIYFDRVSQIRMDRWTRGRTALIGDAAACVSLLAGEGTGLAMMEAYVLAGELQRSGGNHATAFSRYEARMQPFLRQKQRAATRFASAFAPRSTVGIRLRNLVSRLLQFPPAADFLLRTTLRDEITLPEYQL
jgi:2-polyprenyl-6-methoxyphenol hydroxylase-like FAD-dependent oxidoreductase